MKMKTKDKEQIKYTIGRQKLVLTTFFKWLFCSILSGGLLGVVGSAFNILILKATAIRADNWFMLLLLPFSGLLIVFLYRASGEAANTGTNLVITAIHSNDTVPIHVAPLIMISTLITHLFGGSSGREGAALQIGGCVGAFLGRLLNFDEEDVKIFIMCGMSACFSALFGTPIAAAIFSIEVISIGIMHYSALVPCVLSSLIAKYISIHLGITGSNFLIGDIPSLTIYASSKIILIAAAFAVASIALCTALHHTTLLYAKIFKNPYIRIFVAGLLIIALRYIFNSTDYLGAGTDIISLSFLSPCAWYVFILKLIFTAITLGGGFKGGEIVPTLFVGATLGSFISSFCGLPTGLCAACGMVSLFCGVTNCPITSLLLAIELFGADGSYYFIICIAISYLLSGYYSLYNSQKIVYSKYKTRFVNKKTI